MSKRWPGLLFFMVWIGGSGVAHAALTASPDPVAIGSVQVGQSQTATTTLSANPTVDIATFDRTAVGCSEFQVMPPTQLPLTVGTGGGSGGAKTVTVQLTPTSTGAKSCTITARDSGNASLGTFTATGTGTAPQISVAPGSLTFATTEVGRTSAAQTVTATNTGNATLTVSSATLVAGAADYTIITGQTGAQTIAPTTSATWTIACKPSAQGARPGTFRIASDSLAGATTDVTLTCTGEQGIVETNPTSLNFGPVAAGTSQSLNFTLKNNGNVPITGITGVLNNATIGYQFNLATATLAAGASTPLTVTFAPLSGTDGGPATITFTASWGNFGATTTATLTLNGDGQAPGYDVSPVALDFGNFRFDTRPQKVFHITNTSQTTVTIQTLTFTPAAGTATTEIGFTISGVATSLPKQLGAGQQLDVTVTAQPNNRIGLVSGRFDIRSDFATMPDRQVTLTGNATTAGISTLPIVDFGPVDIDGPAQTQAITLTNTGTAVLDLASITKQAGASTAFQITLPSGATQVAPGTSLSLQVTYAPTVERPANQFDTMVLVANLAGIAGGPSQAMITVQGRGIDRHLFVDAVAAFPPTFRNPGDAAPVQAVTVQNTGEATLHVTAVMVTGDPVWQLVGGSTIDVPGGASHDFQVKFSPAMVGPAPDGLLTIVNNDNARPMALVMLTGNGIGRNVAFGPSTIHLGYAGVGIPITAADILAVTNLDPSVSFKIHEIQLDDDSVFRIDNAPADVELPAAMASSFSVTFEPTVEGRFETTARLFLDQDGQEQASVTITGDAVFVDARGSGGCHAGGAGAGSGAVLAFGMLVACGALRRRRRRAGQAIAATALVAAIAIAPAARADGIGITVFEPTPATRGTGFQLQSPEVGSSGSWGASAVMSFASNPLVLDARNPDGTLLNSHTVIENSSGLQLGGAYALLGRFEVGAHIPLYMQSGQAGGDPRVGFTHPPASGTARGNLRLHAKARLGRAGAGLGNFVAGASAIVVVPTASQGQFTGSDQPELRLLALGSFTPAALASRLALSVNAGAILRGKSEYANIVQQSGVAWSVGASYRVLDALWATTEVFGEATPSGRRQQAGASPMPPAAVLSPVEWLAGLSYRLGSQVTVGLAGGRGVTDGLGTPAARVVFSLAFVPGAPALEPIRRAPDEPAGDAGDAAGDADRDGIADRADGCPREPEDKDLFNDTDGCADPDNDRDGVPDGKDTCALEPEDKDGFQDSDGCADPDNDGDGITDARDRCPGQPESLNGKDDDDGCPDQADTTAVAATGPGSTLKAAEATFLRGRELLTQGKYQEACVAFEQSQRLDPQFGTQYNIASCYEKTGKLATAWNLYRELARSDTNPTRRSKAGELAAALAARVPRIKLVLPLRPEGVQVHLNGENATALIGIETPVDFGSYGIAAGASGHRAWRKTIEIREQGKVVTVVIDLAPAR
jgi:hypothetical protein